MIYSDFSRDLRFAGDVRELNSKQRRKLAILTRIYEYRREKQMLVRNDLNESPSKCNFGDKRLAARALYIQDYLRVKYGQPLSKVFNNASDLKRTYEFLANSKTSFQLVVEPSHHQTASYVRELPIILSVGDTTFLDYKKIKVKREEYGTIGNGGNGLILHTSLAVDPDCGQPLGILWEKVWKREKAEKGKKKGSKTRPFEEKESYKWVEAIKKVLENLQEANPISGQKVIHVFDREGDISEVFEEVQSLDNCGVLVRATHNRSLKDEGDYLWDYLQKQPVQFSQEIELPKNHKRKERTANLEIRFCQVKLRSPQRLKETDSFNVYAVYATEINVPEGEEPISWMLLTTEIVESISSAKMMLRWYSYRWLIEEYHKILKSGCKAESYRLKGNSMEVLLGFLTKISADLLRMTYLHRNQPESRSEQILTPVQLKVLKVKSLSTKKAKSVETIQGAIEAIARLGGYLEHRRKTPIGITVLWRGWLELMSLCEGWELRETL